MTFAYPTINYNFMFHFKWGVLYPLKYSLWTIHLQDSKTCIGKSSLCDKVITQDQVPLLPLALLSKLHFIVEKEESGVVTISNVQPLLKPCSSSNFLSILADKSTNGTFINGHKIGRGKKKVLEHNSTITLAGFPAFVYMRTQAQYQEVYPLDLRKKYTISKELSRGACGVVHLAFRKTDTEQSQQRLAIKMVGKVVGHLKPVQH